nr:MAG TPA: hypothetical protein [Bacteriophage sp.]
MSSNLSTSFYIYYIIIFKIINRKINSVNIDT